MIRPHELSARYRGRTASYPTAPAQTCTEPAEVSRRAILSHRALQTASLPQHAEYLGVYAIPRSEVRLVDPTQHVRARFPLRAMAACQPLPHVNGLPSQSNMG
jgi:hypothetical protein